MMTQEQFYYLKLGEEAVEVSHMCSKIMQFGAEEQKIGLTDHNKSRLHKELDDMQAMIEHLNQFYGLDYAPNRDNIDAKHCKVAKYLAKSIELGQVVLILF
jgi:hypothetical protein